MTASFLENRKCFCVQLSHLPTISFFTILSFSEGLKKEGKNKQRGRYISISLWINSWHDECVLLIQISFCLLMNHPHLVICLNRWRNCRGSCTKSNALGYLTWHERTDGSKREATNKCNETELKPLRLMWPAGRSSWSQGTLRKLLMDTRGSVWGPNCFATMD